MATTNLLITLLTGLFLLVIVAVIAGIRNWQRETPAPDEGPGLVSRALGSPLVWTAAFAALSLGIAGLAVLFVGGTSVPEVNRDAVGLALFLSVLLVIAGYLGVGIYSAAHSRGMKSAQAAAISSVVLGTLFLLVVLVRLLGIPG